MAITNAGTQNLLSLNDLPSDYVRPIVATFTDGIYKATFSLTVLKATVENSDAKVTMQNIIENATIGIDKQIDDIIAADYLATATVTHYQDWTNISNNFAAVNGKGAYLKADAASYLVTVKLFLKSV